MYASSFPTYNFINENISARLLAELYIIRQFHNVQASQRNEFNSDLV